MPIVPARGLLIRWFFRCPVPMTPPSALGAGHTLGAGLVTPPSARPQVSLAPRAESVVTAPPRGVLISEKPLISS
jgi:hypothetical protein